MEFFINNIRWSILYVNPDSYLLTRSDGSRTVGVCDISLKTIFISKLLYGAFLRKVLIHEICHSAMASYGIEMSIEQEELFCDLISTYGDEIISITDDMFRILKERVA